MFVATFNIFQSLTHMCYRQGSSGGSQFLPLSILFQSFTAHVLQVGCSGCSFLLPLSIMFQSFTTRVLQSGHSEHSCVMPLSIFNHLPHLCCCQGGSRGLCFMPLSILFQSFTTPELQAGGLRRLMFYTTFNNVSVIYHTCGIGKGAQEAHVLCHFQYCLLFTIPLLQAWGSGGSCFMPLSILFQSFTTPVLQTGGLEDHVFCHFQ